MAIKALYKKYFQKSVWFLYPNLGIRRRTNFSPINTYLIFNDEISQKDEKLIVLHEDDNSEDYRRFEKNVLFKNRFFQTFHPCADNKIAYIFTFQGFSEDWFNFLSGRYSRLSPPLKDSIEKYVGKGTPEWDYISSFLYPERHLDLYAELLATGDKDIAEMRQILQQLGELCDCYDPNREALHIRELPLPNL